MPIIDLDGNLGNTVGAGTQLGAAAVSGAQGGASEQTTVQLLLNPTHLWRAVNTSTTTVPNEGSAGTANATVDATISDAGDYWEFTAANNEKITLPIGWPANDFTAAFLIRYPNWGSNQVLAKDKVGVGQGIAVLNYSTNNFAVHIGDSGGGLYVPTTGGADHSNDLVVIAFSVDYTAETVSIHMLTEAGIDVENEDVNASAAFDQNPTTGTNIEVGESNTLGAAWDDQVAGIAFWDGTLLTSAQIGASLIPSNWGVAESGGE